MPGPTYHVTVNGTKSAVSLGDHRLQLRAVEPQGTDATIVYPLIQSCTLCPATLATQVPLIVRTRMFEVLTLLFEHSDAAADVYASLKELVAPTSIERYLAFSTPPLSSEAVDGWSVYEPKREMERMGVGGTNARTTAWRWTDINKDYDFCSTYPAQLVVPAKISDVTLRYGRTYRSKNRVPALVYLHRHNLGSITRASQPMVGLKNARSIQDEKLVEAIFQSHTQHSGPTAASASVVYGAKAANVIIDARPTTNAIANVAKGAGTENMERYRNSTKVYLGIDNIHVMRDSLRTLLDGAGRNSSSLIWSAFREADMLDTLDRRALRRSGWLRHITALLEGAVLIARNVHLANSHVLVHCSDGWDRTSQLSALAQLCLDPYYRTMQGFAVLIEKDFVSFGHKFSDRLGHVCADRTEFVVAPGDDLSPQAALLATVQRGLHFQSHAFKETCPVFHQFLDCTYQLVRQFPTRFEFDQSYLSAIYRAAYSCEYGSFLYNSEREREEARARQRTRSIWSDLLLPHRRQDFLNAAYDPTLDAPDRRAAGADMGVILPDPRSVVWWTQLFGREMATEIEIAAEEAPTESLTVDSAATDPVISVVERSPLPANDAVADTVARFAGLWASARRNFDDFR